MCGASGGSCGAGGLDTDVGVASAGRGVVTGDAAAAAATVVASGPVSHPWLPDVGVVGMAEGKNKGLDWSLAGVPGTSAAALSWAEPE